MQKLNIYAIFDRKSLTYGIPFFAPVSAVALRMCQTAVNSGSPSDVSLYPEDFSLYCLGSFTDTDGCIHPSAPEFLINLAELKVIPKVSGEGCRGETSPTARVSAENAHSDAPDKSSVVLPVPSFDTVLGAPAKQESPIIDER